MGFGEKLKRLRNDAGLDKLALAQYLKVSLDEVERIEALDVAGGISVDIAMRLSDILDVGLEFLLREEGVSKSEDTCDFRYLKPDCVSVREDILQIISELRASLSFSKLSENYKKLYGEALQIVMGL